MNTYDEYSLTHSVCRSVGQLTHFRAFKSSKNSKPNKYQSRSRKQMENQQVNSQIIEWKKSVRREREREMHRKTKVLSLSNRTSRWYRDIITIEIEIKMKWSKIETKCLTRNNTLNIRLGQSHANYLYYQLIKVGERNADVFIMNFFFCPLHATKWQPIFSFPLKVGMEKMRWTSNGEEQHISRQKKIYAW